MNALRRCEHLSTTQSSTGQFRRTFPRDGRPAHHQSLRMHIYKQTSLSSAWISVVRRDVQEKNGTCFMLHRFAHNFFPVYCEGAIARSLNCNQHESHPILPVPSILNHTSTTSMSVLLAQSNPLPGLSVFRSLSLVSYSGCAPTEHSASEIPAFELPASFSTPTIVPKGCRPPARTSSAVVLSGRLAARKSHSHSRLSLRSKLLSSRFRKACVILCAHAINTPSAHYVQT